MLGQIRAVGHRKVGGGGMVSKWESGGKVVRKRRKSYSMERDDLMDIFKL